MAAKNTILYPPDHTLLLLLPPPPPLPQVLKDLPERDAMDFVAMEAGEVAKGETWAEQEAEEEEAKSGAGAMDEEEDDDAGGDGDESMEVSEARQIFVLWKARQTPD